jgi:subtilase family serine protease
MNSRGFFYVRIAVIVLLLAHPILAERPPQGFARPPIHVKGNAASSPTGLSPATVRHAYGFDQITNQGEGQNIGIVDAYDHPKIESDLNVFSSKFGLPSCTSSNGCFRKVFASNPPRTNAGWALEIALDVEWAHAIAPKAKILLVEAPSNSLTDLLGAVDVAVENGASVVSMSWGGSEFSSESSYDSHFFVSNVTFTASSGDSGNGVEYPAASPFVVSVGGTTLNLDSSGTYMTESGWSGSGGGQSAFELEPLYQANYPILNNPAGKRGVPDVSFDGNPATGFSVYDSVKYQGQSGWFQVAGTSAGAPQWAALFAIVNSVRAGLSKSPLNSTNDIVYAVGAQSMYSANYHDVSLGSNGACGAVCTASTGYDYVTGLGSPKAPALVVAMANQ